MLAGINMNYCRINVHFGSPLLWHYIHLHFSITTPYSQIATEAYIGHLYRHWLWVLSWASFVWARELLTRTRDQRFYLWHLPIVKTGFNFGNLHRIFPVDSYGCCGINEENPALNPHCSPVITLASTCHIYISIPFRKKAIICIV